MYQERLWDCDENIRRADCLRKTGFLEPRSQFSQTLRAWLRRGVASLTFRTKNIGQCRDADAAASSAVCAAAELNCLAGQQYCSVDPDGFAGAEGGSGQSVLIEAIRTRCVNNVRPPRPPFALPLSVEVTANGVMQGATSPCGPGRPQRPHSRVIGAELAPV